MTRLDLIGRTAELIRKLQRENNDLKKKVQLLSQQGNQQQHGTNSARRYGSSGGNQGSNVNRGDDDKVSICTINTNINMDNGG